MAFFNSSADALLVNSLDESYFDMAYGGNYAVLIGMFRKEDFGGDAKKVPLKYAFGSGNGATAATAYANAGLALRTAFVVTPFTCYGESLVPLNQAAFTNGENAAVALLMDEAKTAMNSCRNQADAAMGATGYGELGTIASSTGSGPSYVLTMTYQSDINHLRPYVGSTFASKATPSSASLDTGTFTINAVADFNKTVTVTANNSWAPTNGHVVGLSGTLAASASPVAWPGVPGWIPPAASRPLASNDSFFGVNRSISETLLAGSALDISGPGGGVQTILDGINTLDATIADVPGSNPDLAIMSFQNIGKIKASAQTQNRYSSGTVQGQDISVFYKSIKVDGTKGEIDIVGSSNWPSYLVGVLDKSTWVIGSPGNKPFVPATADGNPTETVPGQDTAVTAYRGNFLMWCVAPGYNGMLTVKA